MPTIIFLLLAAAITAGYSDNIVLKNENGWLITCQTIDSIHYSDKIPAEAAEKAYRNGESKYFMESKKITGPFGATLIISREEMIAKRVGNQIKAELSHKEIKPTKKFNRGAIIANVFLVFLSVFLGIGLFFSDSLSLKQPFKKLLGNLVLLVIVWTLITWFCTFILTSFNSINRLVIFWNIVQPGVFIQYYLSSVCISLIIMLTPALKKKL